MQIKKTIFVCLILCVAFGLTGCGQKGPLYLDHKQQHQKQQDDDHPDVASEINAAL